MRKLLCILLLFITQLDAQQLAFPSAYGPSAFITGGRNGQVIHVTNLNTSGPGSFKKAIETQGSRTIVFDVSGIIDITALPYKKYSNNITIAGQTAPDGGITFVGGRLFFKTIDNLIIRHVRFKDILESNYSNSGDLSESVISNKTSTLNQIIDHCSFDFGKTIPKWYSSRLDKKKVVDKTTIQNCLFSKTIKNDISAGNFVVGKTYIIPSNKNNTSPSFLQGNTDYTLSGAANNKEHTLFIATNAGSGTGIAYEKWYGKRLPSINLENILRSKNNTQNNYRQLITNTTLNIGCNVRLNEDGSLSNNLDVLDSKYIHNTDTDAFIPNTKDLILKSRVSNIRPDNFYLNNQHIPEAWFSANVPIGKDHNDIAPSGYSWLEEYLNQVDTTNNANITASEEFAFPSAYGAGAYTSGGRGGDVIHVTNLNSEGPGSFREAITTKSPRYIIFDVSGVINLETQINILGSEYNDLTVNGFSAPYGGITFIGSTIRTSGVDNQIWRGIRFRNGYKDAEAYENSTCFANRAIENFIVDRCSFSFGLSQCFSAGIAGTRNYADAITIQNSLFGNSVEAMLLGNSSTENFGNTSVLRNVIIDIGWRQPKAGGAIDLDIINNYSHNWQSRVIRMDAFDYKLNQIGNFYQPGNLTRINDNDETLFATWTNEIMSPKIWSEDNSIGTFTYNSSQLYDPEPENYSSQPETAWESFNTSVEPIRPEWFVNSRLPIQGREIPILLSSNLKTELFPKVGVSEYIDNNGEVKFYRDAIDTDLINNALIIADNLHTDASEYEALAIDLMSTMPSVTRPANFYVSNPHIPEVWFSANVPSGQDHNDLAPSNYTWLEEYLNQVDGTLDSNSGSNKHKIILLSN